MAFIDHLLRLYSLILVGFIIITGLSQGLKPSSLGLTALFLPLLFTLIFDLFKPIPPTGPPPPSSPQRPKSRFNIRSFTRHPALNLILFIYLIVGITIAAKKLNQPTSFISPLPKIPTSK